MRALPSRRVIALVSGVVLALLLAACRAGSPTASSPPGTASGDTLEAPPTTAPAPTRVGVPGELIRAEAITAPAPFRSWRLSYHSRGDDNRDIAVTGLLVTPNRPPPPGGFPLISWAHPTTGTADSCAPSRKGIAGVPFPEEIVAKGWAVVATDYEGLGTADAHPYLVGSSEGHTVLDAARAASQIDGGGIAATSPITIWGFSQGGHAAAFAGELAPTYAPELAIKGDVIVAPVSDVAHFARRAEGRRDQIGVLVTIVSSFARTYPRLDPAEVFTPEVVGQLPELEQRCIGEVNSFFDRPIETTMRHRATELAEFARRFAENEAGQRAPRVPVLVVQGDKDDIVDPADTRAFVDRYCGLGVATASVIRPDVGHGAMDAVLLLAWTTDRFAGAPAGSDCPGSSSTATPTTGHTGTSTTIAAGIDQGMTGTDPAAR